MADFASSQVQENEYYQVRVYNQKGLMIVG
jgi:hypothetical protein